MVTFCNFFAAVLGGKHVDPESKHKLLWGGCRTSPSHSTSRWKSGCCDAVLLGFIEGQMWEIAPFSIQIWRFPKEFHTLKRKNMMQTGHIVRNWFNMTSEPFSSFFWAISPMGSAPTFVLVPAEPICTTAMAAEFPRHQGRWPPGIYHHSLKSYQILDFFRHRIYIYWMGRMLLDSLSLNLGVARLYTNQAIQWPFYPLVWGHKNTLTCALTKPQSLLNLNCQAHGVFSGFPALVHQLIPLWCGTMQPGLSLTTGSSSGPSGSFVLWESGHVGTG